MKKRNKFVVEEKLNSENRNIFTIANSTIENTFIKEKDLEQMLENHKSSLLSLFKSIKIFQNDYFSRENNSNKIKFLKKSLNILKENLSRIEKEKMKQFNALKVAKEDSIMRKQEILFPENEDNNIVNYEYDLSSSYIKKKIELNCINFQLQNEIEKTDILIGIKNKTYLYLKLITFYLNLNREIFCKNNQEDTETVSEILKKIQTLVKNQFISIVKEKMETDLEIDSVTSKIKVINDNKRKYKNGNNKYVKQDEIIYEDPKEHNRTLVNNQNKRNTYSGHNKISSNKNLFKTPSNNLTKKHLSIDEALENNLHRNKILELFLKNNDIMNNKINQINNFLNINVNINFGNNKYNCSSSSSENDEDSKYNQNVNNNSDISSNHSEEEIKENDD